MNDKDKKREYEKPLHLDMSFDEALARTAQTDPQEVIDISKEGMSEENIENLIDAFEASSNMTDDSEQYWFARDLQKLFEYGEWRNFAATIERAKIACEQSGNVPEDHFVDVNKMIELAKGAEREIDDIMLSRYACYLIAQNADARKKSIAFAQTYFAIQTRRQELADEAGSDVVVPLSEDEKRVYVRNQIKEHNKQLSSAAKGAGVVTPEEFAIFHSHGYQGLYGKTVPQIRKHKGLSKSANILDRMGSTELAANFFRVTQTEEKLRKDKIRDKGSAYQTHYEVGRQVRDAMLKISGVAPEDLPAVDSIKKAENRLKKDSIQKPSIEKKQETPSKNDVAKPVDLNADLWKYALLIMATQDDGRISTSDLISELPKFIQVPEESQEKLASRNDSKFSQLVRNLKSHKASKTNFIYLGYAKSVRGGFEITEKGREFVIKEFS